MSKNAIALAMVGQTDNSWKLTLYSIWFSWVVYETEI